MITIKSPKESEEFFKASQMNQPWIKFLPFFLKKRLEGRHNLQDIFVNSGWLFADKVIRMLFGLFVGVWTARYLGPDQFGSLNFAIAFVSLFGALSSLGVDSIVVRDLVRTPETQNETLSSAMMLKFFGGITAFLCSVFIISFVYPVAIITQILVIIIAAGMIFQCLDVVDLWFQAQVKSKYTVISRNIAFIVAALIKIVLILSDADLIYFAWMILFEAILGAICLLTAFFINKPLNFKYLPKKIISYKLIKESWPLLLSSFAVMIYMRIDQIMLSAMIDNKEVGIYSAALRLSEIWYFVPTVIVSSVIPALVKAKAESEEIYLNNLRNLFNILIVIAYSIALPITLISTKIVHVLYGPDYISAGNILAVHIWTAVFVFMGVGSTPWTINENAVKYSLLQTVSGIIVNISLNLVLIPHYGGIGAAISTLIAQVFACFAINALLVKTRQLFYIELNAMLYPLLFMKSLLKSSK